MRRYERSLIVALVINVNSIPAFQRDALADMAIRLTREYFKTPGVEEKYQKWLAERKSAKGDSEIDQKQKFEEKEAEQ